MKCVRDCPTHNIYYEDGKIKFRHSCQMCMRCSFFCPVDAISIGNINSWRVNGAYNFRTIENNDELSLPYITKKAKGFYRCFIRYFANIDKAYSEYISGHNE